MKKSIQFLMIAAAIASSGIASAQAAPGGPRSSPPGKPHFVGGSPCSSTFSLPGFRVTEEDISHEKDATVRYLDECSTSYVLANFGFVNAASAIEANKKLKAYLRHQGVFPQDVVAAQLVRGELIVFVENT